MGGGSTFIVKYSKLNINAYAEGGSVAEEVISSVRNAVAFGTQDRLARQYDSHLIRAELFGFRVKGSIGIMVAGMMGTSIPTTSTRAFPFVSVLSGASSLHPPPND